MNEDAGQKGTMVKRPFVERYGISMKMFLPFRIAKQKNEQVLDDEKIGCCSYLSLNWMNRFMWLSSRTQLTDNEIKNLNQRNNVNVNSTKLAHLLKLESKKSKPSLFRAICKFNMIRLIFAAIFITLMAIFNYVGPTWVLREMLICLDDPNIPLWHGIAWAVVFSLTQLIRHFMFSAFWVTSAYAGIKATVALQGLVYERMLQASTANDISTAEVVSFVTSDMERIYQLIQSMILAVPPSLITVTHIVYCYLLLGPWTLLGNLVMILYAPFMLFVTKFAVVYRGQAAKMADQRIGIMNQLLFNIKFIKMLAWEKIFTQIVDECRLKEAKSLRSATLLQSVSWSTVVIAGNLALMLSTIGYLLTGGVLDTIQVLNLMSAYAALSTPLGTVVLAVKAMSDGFISCKRIQDFLMSSNVSASSRVLKSQNHSPIVISDLDIGWGKAKNKAKPDDESVVKSCDEDENNGIVNVAFHAQEVDTERAVLSDVNLKVNHGQLIGICGSVGSGKSTLLSTICGNTQSYKGSINVNGSIALVTQQAWIFHGTIKQNILFGLPFDDEWYRQVISACCLELDFQLMANGDETEIGERGANLSGGQKQRVNLARALYSRKDIYLLDDPLSALDAKVAQHIFGSYIKNHLQDKTVLLVTHVIHYLEYCDHIVVIDKGGIEEQGSHQQLLANNGIYYKMVKQNIEKNKVTKENLQEEHTHEPKPAKDIIDENGNFEAKMIKAEMDSKTKVTFKSLQYYCKHSGGYFTSIFTYLSIMMFGGMAVFNNVWFKIWLSTESRHSPNVTNTTGPNSLFIVIGQPDFYGSFTIYVCSMAALLGLAAVKGSFIASAAIKGNNALHAKMLFKVIRSPMTFFDSTPLGRVVNRFSRDLDEMDVHIPSLLEYVNQSLFIVILQVIIVCNLYPWFTVALVFVIVLFIIFDKVFTPSVQEIKRMDNLLKPPVINHLNTSVQGLEVIKCYGKQRLFTDIFHELVEKHTSAYLQYQLSSKWISFRVDIIGWISITVLALMIMYTKSSLSELNGGLSLVLVIQACITLSVAMRFKSELEAKLTSLQRITDYSMNLVEEAPAIIQTNRPPDQWPSKGAIEFRNVFMRYRPESPLVLQGLTVSIKAGEKVGIIGRTGAGKSSILAAFLRLTEICDGAILIDDVDISKIGLEDLRGRMAVIPQEPVLLSGTIRWNLDPTNKYTDEEIWETLDKAYLKNKIMEEPFQLQATISSETGMFSVGEKQLFCLARALLRKSKVLLLDEATANVDEATDKLIQNSIRKFFDSCTVLTIAHRLNTIVNYDKILTMEAGKVLEFDSPKNLLATNSQFQSMLRAQV